MTTPRRDWDEVYTADTPPPWDIGRPQPAFVRLADDGRPRYVASLASVLRPGGRCYLMCFSDRQPGEFGPRRVRQDELRAAFSDGWTITSIEADTFEVNPGMPAPVAQAWLATVRRT